MPAAPIPNNEPQRLAALLLCQVLDTPEDPAFDDLTQMAAELLDMPVCLVSLVDKDRQWFKSRFGLEATQTPRDQAFCAYAILQDTPFVIQDATQDPRTCDNPLVTGEPGIRFYAGIPLILDDGHAVGTMCVIDTKPRIISEHDLATLGRLARQVTHLLQLYRESARANERALQVRDMQEVLNKHTLYSVADRAGKIIDVNEGFCQISGYTREELIGEDHRMLNSGHHPKSFWNTMWRTLQSGKPWRAEVCNRAKDGSLYWVDSTNIPQFDAGGKIERYISLRFEVTDKVEAQRQLENAIQQAEKANKAKSDFLANMSHEIRTPMTAILGFTDLLISEQYEPHQFADAIMTIRSNANHLLTVINDILDVSKIEAEEMKVESIPTHPVQIIEEVASLIKPRANGKGVEVCVQYDTPMPIRIFSDPTRLRQILLNLTGNAIKFTEGGRITLYAACEPNEQKLILSVVDTGIGMTTEQVQTIARFQAFTQADESMTRKFGGTGLGLRISNALTRLLGGEMSIDSTIGQGSAFTFTIATGELAPNALVEPDQLKTLQLTQSATTHHCLHEEGVPPLEGRRIMLAEDGRDNQRLIKHHLKKAGAQVTICDNGLIAVQAIETATDETMPELILMDMQMPELDGYGATRRLREQGCKLPIVALTAHAMEGDRQKCLEAGCDDYLTKPVDKAELVEVCENWVSSQRRSRARRSKGHAA